MKLALQSLCLLPGVPLGTQGPASKPLEVGFYCFPWGCLTGSGSGSGSAALEGGRGVDLRAGARRRLPALSHGLVTWICLSFSYRPEV